METQENIDVDPNFVPEEEVDRPEGGAERLPDAPGGSGDSDTTASQGGGEGLPQKKMDPGWQNLS